MAAAAELRIEGIDGELRQNVRAYVALTDESCDAEAWRIRRRFRALEQEARTALEPFGYYSPHLESELTLGETCWSARLEVEPGSPVLIRSADIAVVGEALDDPGFVMSVPEPVVGVQLRHRDYENYKRALQVTAAARGYFDAEFTESRLDVWPEELAADIALSFDSGRRYRLGEISYTADFLDDRIIEGYVDLEPGRLYDREDIARAYRDLSNSGYFSRIELTPDYASLENGRVPLRLLLEPADRIEYTAGAGFATDTGMRLTGGYRNRRMNSAGNRFNSSLTLSPVISGLTAEYRKPLTDPRADWLSYTAAVDIEDTKTFDSEAFRIGIRRSKRLSESWLRTLFVDLNVDQFTVADVTDTSRLLLPGVSYDHKRADNDIYPSRGRRFTVDIRGSSDALLSDTSLLQLIVRAHWIRAIGDNGRVLARLTAGTTAIEEFTDLPPAIRFFAGGDESIRGYGYETLGPVDEEGNVIGGNHLAVGSLEYEHRVRGNFYGAVFVDGGNAFNGDAFDPVWGAGLGVKWRSPVGPIRLYLAHPFDLDDRDVRVHLSLGVGL